VLAGPFCSYQLATLGADVIKIESPLRPDFMRKTPSVAYFSDRGLSSYYLTQNANKRSLTLDLQMSVGVEVFHKLVASADVLVENYGNGTLEKLGIGYEAMSLVNPTLIYCSISGFGSTGDKSDHPAYDTVVQAASGFMDVDREVGGAARTTTVPIIDYSTGVYAAMAISAALLQRSTTGIGQFIDISLMDTALMMMGPITTNTLNAGSKASYGGDIATATMATYETADGKLVLGAGNHGQMVRLWRAINQPDEAAIVENTTMAQIYDRADYQRELLVQTLAQYSANHWMPIFHAADVPAEKVLTIQEALQQPQIKSRSSLFQTVASPHDPAEKLTLPVSAFSFAHGGPSLHSPPPDLGQHSEQVLKSVGYNADQINRMRQEKVI
jgi:crotonobetainyl-CoA:carnitine CoA-transferase CaiB-like acyl-CoA transferase